MCDNSSKVTVFGKTYSFKRLDKQEFLDFRTFVKDAYLSSQAKTPTEAPKIRKVSNET